MLRIVFCAIFILHVESAFGAECEHPWFQVGIKCLRKSSTEVYRAENLRNCRDDGAMLVSPRSYQENEQVKDFIGKESGRFWLSGQRFVYGNPNYRWMDGSEIKYGDWVPGQPYYHSHSGPICLAVDASKGWYDYYCEEAKYKQLCEKPIKSLQQKGIFYLTESYYRNCEETKCQLQEVLNTTGLPSTLKIVYHNKK